MNKERVKFRYLKTLMRRLFANRVFRLEMCNNVQAYIEVYEVTAATRYTFNIEAVTIFVH